MISQYIELFIAIVIAFYFSLLIIDFSFEHSIKGKVAMVLCTIITVLALIYVFRLPIFDSKSSRETTNGIIIVSLGAVLVYGIKLNIFKQSFMKFKERHKTLKG